MFSMRLVAALALGSIQFSLGQQNSFTQMHVFGAASLNTGQTMRLNVVNPGVLLPSIPALACQVQLVFLNPSGSSLKMVGVTVAPFNSATADLNRDSDIASGDTPVVIHAVVRNLQVITGPSNPVPSEAQFCPLVATVEIIDNATLKTQSFVPNVKVYTTLPGAANTGR